MARQRTTSHTHQSNLDQLHSVSLISLATSPPTRPSGQSAHRLSWYLVDPGLGPALARWNAISKVCISGSSPRSESRAKFSSGVLLVWLPKGSTSLDVDCSRKMPAPCTSIPAAIAIASASYPPSLTPCTRREMGRPACPTCPHLIYDAVLPLGPSSRRSTSLSLFDSQASPGKACIVHRHRVQGLVE